MEKQILLEAERLIDERKELITCKDIRKELRKRYEKKYVKSLKSRIKKMLKTKRVRFFFLQFSFRRIYMTNIHKKNTLHRVM